MPCICCGPKTKQAEGGRGHRWRPRRSPRDRYNRKAFDHPRDWGLQSLRWQRMGSRTRVTDADDQGGSADSTVRLQEITKVVEEMKETGVKNTLSTPSSMTPLPDSSSPVVSRVTERSITTMTTTTPTSVAKPNQERPCICRMPTPPKGECEKPLTSCNFPPGCCFECYQGKNKFLFF